MAWCAIRKATTQDTALLEKRAKAFALRHYGFFGNKARYPDITWVNFLEDGIAYERLFGDAGTVDDANRLAHLWLRVVQRALGRGAEGIAHGHVGYEAS